MEETTQHADTDPDSASSRPEAADGTTAAVGEPLRRGDRTRNRILDAAEQAFGEHGFHGASIVEITRNAGVGLGTFYVYFPSKIEIYRHLLRSYLEDFLRVARDATSGADDLREMVRQAFGAYFEWVGARPGVMRLLREAEFVDPTLLSELYKAPAEEFRRRIEPAMQAGYIAPADPEVLAWGIIGMTELSVLRWLVWPGERRMDGERFEAYVDIVVRALGIEPQKSLS